MNHEKELCSRYLLQRESDRLLAKRGGAAAGVCLCVSEREREAGRQAGGADVNGHTPPYFHKQNSLCVLHPRKKQKSRQLLVAALQSLASFTIVSHPLVVS